MSESGATTAEYTVGTLAAASVAAVLAHLVRSGWIPDLILDLIEQAFRPGVLLEQFERLPWLQ